MKRQEDERCGEPDDHSDQLARQVIGAAIEVHRHLGPGYLESLYEQALCIELELRSVPFRRQHPVFVEYKGRPIGEHHLDLLVDGQLVVELKAIETLAPIHGIQIRSYLKATRCLLGLLINFNVRLLREGIWRVIQTP